MEFGWLRGSTVEASKAENHLFVPEQKELERTSTRNRPDVGNILFYWSSQTGFRSCRIFY